MLNPEFFLDTVHINLFSDWSWIKYYYVWCLFSQNTNLILKSSVSRCTTGRCEKVKKVTVQSARALEYADCMTAEG